MHPFEDALALLRARPETRRWPVLAQIFDRSAGHPPVAWDFPLIACTAVGGQPQQARVPIAAITCAHISIILVDDLLDEDPRGAHHKLGIGPVSNLSSGLAGLGIQLLCEAEECKQSLAAAAALAAMLATTAYGQDLDVQNHKTEEAYWAVTRSKSSPYFATALYLGALFGGGTPAQADGLRNFGALFGEIMQIHDDLNDVLAVPANVDWLQGRSPLPLLFAELVDHPQRERFTQLRSQVADPPALQEAQSILVSSGAISYSVNELIFRQKKAMQLLAEMDLVDPAPLEKLLEHVIAPVRHLFESVGAVYAG
jgi:geranylgeranyl pyrophosphate synthase